MQFPPTPPTDPAVDVIGLLTMAIPSLLTLLAFSQRARQAANLLLELYKFFIRHRREKEGHVNTNGNGNGNGHANKQLLENVLHTLRVEADAREAYELATAAQFREVNTRWRRDSDSFHITLGEHADDIGSLRTLFGNHDDRLGKLETALPHINTNLEAIMRRLDTMGVAP